MGNFLTSSSSGKSQHKEEIIKMIKKAGNEEYETSWDEHGIPRSKKKSEIKKGRQSRAKGQRFELKVRQHLEEVLGWIVSKWMNTIDYSKSEKIGKLVPAKRKYNPFFKAMTIGTGFPDFVCFKRKPNGTYEVIGLEVKVNGYLDQKEKGMCLWLLENKIFSRILIAKKGKKRGEIEYVDFKKKYKIK